MGNFLSSYTMCLQTLGPVHVGDGRDISKKEYIFLKNDKRVLIPDPDRMYQSLTAKGLEKKYLEYMLEKSRDTLDARMDLWKWLSFNRVEKREYTGWTRYELDCGDFLQDKGAINIRSCIKDSYGKAYIPGTSIKGMLRTVLMAYELMRSNSYADHMKKQLKERVGTEKGGKYFLAGMDRILQEKTLRRLERRDAYGKPVPVGDAVNDILSGLICGDSSPISLSNLTLCQKNDKNIRGEVHSLNILRESVKPGVSIEFPLTIDSTLCPYSIEEILNAVNDFANMYYEVFLSHFPGTDRPAPGTVWIGGGVGYAAKTLVYPLMGYREGLGSVVDIFRKTLSIKAAKEHKHYRDSSLGVSPHILKTTRYHGNEYQMGQCLLKVLDK